MGQLTFAGVEDGEHIGSTGIELRAVSQRCLSRQLKFAYGCLSDTEEESADEEANVVLDKSRAC